MALYFYEAYSREGKKIKGTLDAPSEETVRRHIQSLNAYPISITRRSQETLSLWQRIITLFAPSISVKDKILFTKQLAVLLRSGVPLLQAMELLIDQFTGRLRLLLIDIKDGIKEGQSLADGLKRYPQAFENVYIQLVRAGETAGNLEVILEQLVNYLEQQEELRKRVQGALRYPIIQLVVILLVVIALLAFVVPQITETFTAQDMALPLATRILISLSDIVTYYWYIILIVLILIIIAFRLWRATTQGARIIDMLKLKLPMIGYFARMGAVAQFSRTLGMLIAGGVNLSEALDIVVNIVDNKVLATTLEQAKEKIIKQGRIAEFLKKTNIFPPIAIYLIKTGEESGNLDTMLLTVAQNYETDLMEYSDTLSAAIGPIMQILIAIIVGFIIFAILGPIQSQVGQFQT